MRRMLSLNVLQHLKLLLQCALTGAQGFGR